jgi:hypothetical protein
VPRLQQASTVAANSMLTFVLSARAVHVVTPPPSSQQRGTLTPGGRCTPSADPCSRCRQAAPQRLLEWRQRTSTRDRHCYAGVHRAKRDLAFLLRAPAASVVRHGAEFDEHPRGNAGAMTGNMAPTTRRSCKIVSASTRAADTKHGSHDDVCCSEYCPLPSAMSFPASRRCWTTACTEAMQTFR